MREVRRLAIRWRKPNGQRYHALLLSTLEPAQVMALVGRAGEQTSDAQQVLTAYVHLHDERGGAIQIEIKESKQWLGMRRRHKKSFCGQQMVMMLSTLAHNLVMWAKRWIVAGVPKMKK